MAPHATYTSSDFLEDSFHQQFRPENFPTGEHKVLPAAVPVDSGNEKDLEELEELKCAVLGFESTNLALNMINRTSFPLPTLALKLKEMSVAIHGKTGHVLIRGIDSIPFTYLQKVIAHTGLTSHLAGKRAMSGIEGGDKTVLHHVTAFSTEYFANREYHAPSNQAGPLLFHNDPGHILSLFTVSQSLTGGEFYLANARKLWEKIKDSRPDLAITLLDDWTWESPSKLKIERGPIVVLRKSQVFVNCSRVRISGTPTRPRPEFLPPLTCQQLEALELLQSAASDVSISLRCQEGDLLAINNIEMMHARGSFVDDERSGHKRHLLRLIARDDCDADILPQSVQARLGKLYDHEDKDEKFDIFRNPLLFSAGH